MDSTKEIEKVKATLRIEEKNVRDSQVSRIAGYWWPGRTWTGPDRSLVKLGV